MTSRWASTSNPLIYEINTWPWLGDLSASAGTSVDLATVPDQQWDAISDMGFDAVWLMGVWRRSPAGMAVALRNPDLVAAFRAALPDWVPEDVVGSPYCIRNYEVDARLGGRAGLGAARKALADRGIALILDFVPNHVAQDHPWTAEHPEYFVHGTSAELRADPDSFVDVDGTVLANGKDPYFAAWSDVVQLDANSPAVRRAMLGTLRDIADQCDGVRCDMAMLVMNDVFARTWGDRVGAPPEQQYWPAMIDAVHHSHPDFRFIAEAYWDREWDLQQQGFDFCYDKRLYDHLVAGDPVAVRRHLEADLGFQSGLLRFVENHDEPRAAEVFDAARLPATTLASLTQPGARLIHHGQLQGRSVHLPVFLGRSPRERVDPALADFYGALSNILRDNAFRTGHWALCETSDQRVLAWCWAGERRWLIIVNLSAAAVSARVRVPWPDVAGGAGRLVDRFTDAGFVCAGGDLPVDLAAWQSHALCVEP